ncbi:MULTISPECIES: transposase [unclassified Microcoleus]|uniref:RNA-guided endonuclease InsQ/TnpB family protein n=1 Tax=unclassified Microcoleus TaxID=2642155 RepID=UPI002FD411FF
MYKAVKVRIYPSPEQEQYLAQCFGNCRWLYNRMLHLTTEGYKDTGKGLSKAAMDKLLPDLKREFEWLGLAYSQSLQRVTFNLSSAFVNFFEGRAKYPTFKKRGAKQSVGYPQNVLLNVAEKSLKFPGTLGTVRTKFHRDLPTGKQGCVTVSMNSDGTYFASILFEVSQETIQPGNSAIGVDLGLKDFAIASDGNKHNQSKRVKRKLQKLERNQKRKQRKLAKKTGTSNRRKAKKLVAKVTGKIARIREDFLHKLSRKIVNENQVIVVEDLAVKNMVKNPNLARAISEQGWGMFLTMLKYKAQECDRNYVEINRFFPSSQLCAETLLPIPMLQKGFDSLNVRFVDCPHCGQKHDRDINAAINIRNEGLRILALGTSAAAIGGNVRPKRSAGRKKSTIVEAIPTEDGSLHHTVIQLE